MAHDPNDDVSKILAKAMEELIRNLPVDDSARFVGCTIITGTGEDTRIFQMDDYDEGLPYELVEDDEFIYITLEIPSEEMSAPSVEFMDDKVVIALGNRITEIQLKSPIHAGQSRFGIKHGIMDILCRKILLPKIE
ncbi:hypothetical protein AZH53_05390 [Methanomicrobiaceae archaeon CYW5]|uniref:heat-shock protein Hsp90 n=1 Tax=Methanovulcanius yangii TaxID=1789227 RepID=UPI0029C9F833|nr:heat-shock protein Hsp90 [Methanovulcanius yangii]MBT8507845.1 hypothetical protein [Methanovulcanius yangii]